MTGWVVFMSVESTQRAMALSLPLEAGVLKVFTVILFFPHLIFANLTVGGLLLAVFCEIVGCRIPRYDILAERIAKTVTVHKSMAVVLGVGPLLCINLAYPEYFYTANILTAKGWLSIVPVLIIGFLCSYTYALCWSRGARHFYKKLHLLLGVITCLIFLWVPVLFLSNTNLMLFPNRWSEVSGFISSLFIGNVFPRYLHFVTASVAVSGLFFAGWFGIRKYEPLLQAGFSAPVMIRAGYGVCFFASLLQFAFGPLVLFTLPREGIHSQMLLTLLGGVFMAILMMMMLWNEIQQEDRLIGKRYLIIVALISMTILFMLTTRHQYREESIREHDQSMRGRTTEFRLSVDRFIQDSGES